ncbi:MAG: hypothetical protein DMF69_14515 [Acidobacteria bacterium]|nr:MAG: hypothetical protein DMF69_14515 [Acidobacteriota bacterium]
MELTNRGMAIKIMRLIFAMVFLLSVFPPAFSQTPEIPETDRIRLAEAFRLGEELGDKVWPKWSQAPFGVLLVTAEHEFLVRHLHPTSDFTLIGYDSLLKSNIYFRKRTQPTSFLATFPAVGGISTIVVGQAENTQAKTSTPWVVTLLHEHFHQLQESQPNTFADINALNLSRGDQTGMWMLNFPFPYETPEMKQQFTLLARALVEALQSKSKTDFSKKLQTYLRTRADLKQMLNADDYKYMSFQLWKEGTARYTEYKIAIEASKRFNPGKEFRALKDFTSFDVVATDVMNGIINELTTLKIEGYKRVAFYPIGAGEALLLDRVKPKWQQRYFVEKFDLEKYFR